MKTLVEPFTSLTGWSSSGGIVASKLNQLSDFIADRQASSVIFFIPAGSLGKTFSKTVTVSLPTDALGSYPAEFVFHIWSRNMTGKQFEQPTDFFYQVSLDNGAHNYYVPTWPTFQAVTIGNTVPLTQVTTITFTVLHNNEDYLILSAMNAITDEYPKDILDSVQREVALTAALQYANGVFPSGDTATGTAGATFVTLAGNHDFIQRYTLIQFGVGGNLETHLVDQYDEVTGVCSFFSSWDGPTLKFSHAADAVNISFAVTITLGETDFIQPSIALMGMQPEHVMRRGEIMQVLDTYDVSLAGGAAAHQEEQLNRYPILIDCEAQQYEMLARLNRIVRQFLGQGYLWVNARKHDFLWDIPPVQIDPDIVNVTLPKTQYTLNLEVREALGARVVMPSASSYNLVMHIVSTAAGDQLPGVAPATVAPTTSLEAWWPFDNESLIDASGNGRDFTTAQAVDFILGIKGLGAYFPDRTVIRDFQSPVINLSAKNQFSISWWARNDANPTGASAFMVSFGAINAQGIQIYMPVSTNNLSLVFYRAGAGESLTAVTTVDNILRHFVLTFDLASKTWIVYRDAVQVGTGVLVNTPLMPNNKVVVGCYDTPQATSDWVGILDEVRIFSRVLSASEVAALNAADRGI